MASCTIKHLKPDTPILQHSVDRHPSFLLGRLTSALQGRTIAVLISNRAAERAALLRDLQHSTVIHEAFNTLHVNVSPEARARDFLRALARAAGLPKKGSLCDLLRAFEAHCTLQYRGGKRVLLVVDDAHLMRTAEVNVVHALSNIVAGEESDLAMGIVLAGERKLQRKLNYKRWRAVRSRVGVSLHLTSTSTDLLCSPAAVEMR